MRPPRTSTSGFAEAAFQSGGGLLRATPHAIGPFLPALIPFAMRHDREIEYIPLNLFGQEPTKKRGFLMRLLDAVFEWCTTYTNRGQASSSGGEVEEKTIEF